MGDGSAPVEYGSNRRVRRIRGCATHIPCATNKDLQEGQRVPHVGWGSELVREVGLDGAQAHDGKVKAGIGSVKCEARKGGDLVGGDDFCCLCLGFFWRRIVKDVQNNYAKICMFVVLKSNYTNYKVFVEKKRKEKSKEK